MDRMSKHGFRAPATGRCPGRRLVRGSRAAACAAILIGLAGCAEWDGFLKPKQKLAPATEQEKPTSAPQVLPVEPVPPPTAGEYAEAAEEDGPTLRSVREYLAHLEAAQNAAPEDVPVEPPPAKREARQESAAATTSPSALSAPQEAPVVLAAAAPQAQPGPVAPQVHAVALASDTELAAPAPKQETVQLNRGMDVNAPIEDATLTRLIEQARSELRASPGDADRQWRLSLLQLAAGRPQDALMLSPELSIESRARLTQTLKAMIAAGRMNGSTGAPPDEVLAAVNELGGALRKDAELRVPVVALCKKVVTFGVYDELPESALVAGRANRVIVYCEIENFSSEQENGEYRTLLSSRLELFTADGKSVWSAEEDRIEDRARQKREDFFLAQLATLPADLTPGEYVLKVTITDLAAGKTNEGVHRFRIGA